MPIAILIVGLQILCGLHVVKAGRQLYWLFIIIIAPVLGCLVYFIAEILPDLRNNRSARRAAGRATQFIDPDRTLRALKDRLEEANTIDNRRALAEEYLRREEAENALELYDSTLSGMHKDDPTLLYGRARALFALRDYAGTAETLDRLRAANPDYQSPDAHLLYARALDEQGRWDEAKQEFDALVGYYPGAEAKCRYALALKRNGQFLEARAIFAEVVKALDRAGRPYIREQREWYDLARGNLR